MNANSGMKLARLLRALDTAVAELGPNLPPRQLMTLLLVAQANQRGETIGVGDIDQRLGDLHTGSASKLLRTMMHVEGERKAGVANTVEAERDPLDLRKWNLRLTKKGKDAVDRILSTL